MSGCSSCAGCGSIDRAQEYKNCYGESAVKCPLCDKEVTFKKLPANHKVECQYCGTEIKVVPLLLN